MFNDIFENRARRCYWRNVSFVVVFLLSIFCFCNKTSTGLAANKCPLFPQKTTPVDPTDPMIRIVSPNGGEVFHVGQQCTVKVCSYYPVPNGELRILVGNNTYTIPQYCPAPLSVAFMAGDSAELADHGDSVVVGAIFTVPDSLCGLVGATNISSITDKCLIQVRAYSPPYYPDTSDCYFSIVK